MSNKIFYGLLCFLCMQNISAGGLPDQLVSRQQAEDPTLELTENPLHKLKGSPREIFTYKCNGSCEDKAYKHVKLDRKGRVTYVRIFRHAREFEYGDVHDMPLLVRDDMWGDGNFDIKNYHRDNFGNIVQEQIFDVGVVKNFLLKRHQALS